MKAAIVGCGFLGSLVGEEAARRAFAIHEPLELTLFDPDVFEGRNVANQNCVASDEGRPKVEALADRMTAIYPAAMIYAIQAKWTPEEDSHDDIYICCVDNVEAREHLWTFCCQKGKMLLDMGISRSGTGYVAWYAPFRGVDDVPFSPVKIALLGENAREMLSLKEKRLPPCELIGHRGLGINAALAASKALFIAIGFDPEHHVLEQNQIGQGGPLTRWAVTPLGHTLEEVHDAW